MISSRASSFARSPARSLVLVLLLVACGDDDGGAVEPVDAGRDPSDVDSGAPPSPCAPPASCDAVVASCLALTDNADATEYALRASQVAFTAPAALSTGLVATLLGSNATPNLATCNLNGGGTFSLLLSFDEGADTITVGAGKPVADPSASYGFVDEEVGTFAVAPVELGAAVGDDGAFETAEDADVVLVAYLDAAASSSIVLPLHGFDVQGRLDANRSCIGSYAADDLDPENACQPVDGQRAFDEGGSFEGYVTLEEADQVVIASLARSLCALLAGSSDGASPIAHCEREGGAISFQGDWCAATNSPADGACADALRVEAGIAASGVRLLE